MRTLHFSISPLAGSPIRIVNALNRHTAVKARHVVLYPGYYGRRVYENDFIWPKDKAEVLEEMEKADIVHLHHFMPLRGNVFGIDFEDFLKKGGRAIRQFHAAPETIFSFSHISPRTLFEDPLPQLVIAQYPERYFPRARLVPNIVPIHDELYTPSKEKAENVQIFFAPTSLELAFELRWGSKGYPETLRLLKKVASGRRKKAEIRLFFNKPHLRCLEEKRRSAIAVDDLVTGSYHLNSLESLSQGIPTFAYLDPRIREILMEITGASDLPWANFYIKDAREALEAMCESRDLREAAGRDSRAWMEKYWDDAEMIRFYVRAYRDLLEDPARFQALRFNADDKNEMWVIRDSHEEAWKARIPGFFQRALLILYKAVIAVGLLIKSRMP
jgi:hypothetical protein